MTDWRDDPVAWAAHVARVRETSRLAAWVIDAVAEHDRASSERDTAATALRLGIGSVQVRQARALLADRRELDGRGAPDDG